MWLMSGNPIADLRRIAPRKSETNPGKFDEAGYSCARFASPTGGIRVKVAGGLASAKAEQDRRPRLIQKEGLNNTRCSAS